MIQRDSLSYKLLDAVDVATRFICASVAPDVMYVGQAVSREVDVGCCRVLDPMNHKMAGVIDPVNHGDHLVRRRRAPTMP